METHAAPLGTLADHHRRHGEITARRHRLVKKHNIRDARPPRTQRRCSRNRRQNPNGRAVRLYRPLVEKTPAAAKETESFLDRVWDGSLAMLVSSLVGEKKLSEDEIEELRKIIDEAEKGERK